MILDFNDNPTVIRAKTNGISIISRTNPTHCWYSSVKDCIGKFWPNENRFIHVFNWWVLLEIQAICKLFEVAIVKVNVQLYI
jgi:hypothetical protein